MEKPRVIYKEEDVVAKSFDCVMIVLENDIINFSHNKRNYSLPYKFFEMIFMIEVHGHGFKNDKRNITALLNADEEIYKKIDEHVKKNWLYRNTLSESDYIYYRKSCIYNKKIHIWITPDGCIYW